MEFLNFLIEQDFGFSRAFNGNRYRAFQGIALGYDLCLSIQASCAHYSRPRETLDDLNKYTHWEVAIIFREDWARVQDILPSFPSLVEIELYHEGSVYPYVPADLVNDLFLALVEAKKRDSLH